MASPARLRRSEDGMMVMVNKYGRIDMPCQPGINVMYSTYLPLTVLYWYVGMG
jgi:hypothetical protein